MRRAQRQPLRQPGARHRGPSRALRSSLALVVLHGDGGKDGTEALLVLDHPAAAPTKTHPVVGLPVDMNVPWAYIGTPPPVFF